MFKKNKTSQPLIETAPGKLTGESSHTSRRASLPKIKVRDKLYPAVRSGKDCKGNVLMNDTA